MQTQSHLVRKLSRGAHLGPGDIERLDQLSASARYVSAGQDLTVEGDDPKHVHFITSGIACRYKHLQDGRRAIVALLLPGDFCDLHVAILGYMDHSIGALTDCEASQVKVGELNAMLQNHPAIHRACLWAGLVDEAILREWLVNVGRRSARQQLAHLICELFVRLEAVGLTRDHTFGLPFTQATLADMLGMTSVHVQRALASVREDGFIVLGHRSISLPDFSALADLGEFEAAYLHLSGRNS